MKTRTRMLILFALVGAWYCGMRALLPTEGRLTKWQTAVMAISTFALVATNMIIACNGED